MPRRYAPGQWCGVIAVSSVHYLQMSLNFGSETMTVVDPGTRISFLFASCRYLSIFRFFCSLPIKYNLKLQHDTIMENNVTNL